MDQSGKHNFQLDREKAVRHLDLCTTLCRLQMAEGRYFLFENPLSANSWQTPSLSKLREDPRVKDVRGDMCAHGMTATKGGETGLALKPTRFLSNSTHVPSEVGQRCSVIIPMFVFTKVGQRPRPNTQTSCVAPFAVDSPSR